MIKKEESNKNQEMNREDRFEKLFGFKLNQLFSWKEFVKLMNRPEDPSCLAVFRILFGNY